MLKYLLGWKTSRKIIVIESDDWGSFRFKNESIRDKYIKGQNKSSWMAYNDCFESYEDLKGLSQILTSVKDKNDNSACFTFLMNPANPDFNKIEASGHKNYYYENFQETIEKRKDGKEISEWYRNALQENLIEIGFHGREHLNEVAWMQDLKAGHKETHNGFKDRIWGQGVFKGINTTLPHRSTFALNTLESLESHKKNIREGIFLINRIFNQKTTYFLPPDGPYHLMLNQNLKDNGIKFIGLAKKHNNPLENNWHQKKFFWQGKTTKEGLKVITRNVTFEPSSPKSKDWVDKALTGIGNAFKYKTPAVVSTHRANYTGTLNKENRINSQKQLKDLLYQVKNKWPEVEFMTSSQLGNVIKST